MATTTDRGRKRVPALITVLTVILVSISWASASGAAGACDRCRSSDAPLAAKKDREESLLEKVGLGSLEDIPWDAFPAALALSALIGAAGGFVYAGIAGGGPFKDDSPDEGTDRPSP